MDVLLINTPWEQLREDIRRKSGVTNLMPSLGLGYIAAVLLEHGVDVKILDANVEAIPPGKMGPYLLAHHYRPRHIGITATSHTIALALEMAKSCKEALPGSLITLGGVHPTVLPDETLAFPQVDFVIRGEGELAYLELIQERNLEEIAGLSYKQNGRQVHNPPREQIAELDQLPFPAFKLMPISKFHPTLGTYKQLPVMGVIGSRGCPFNCTYCASPAFWGRRVRFRSAANLIQEISLLVNEFGIREVQLLDDTFTASKKRFKEFCTQLAAAPFKITWSCNSRVDCIDAEMLRLMKATGCHSISYGIESADEGMLKSIKKQISLDQARTAIALTVKHGITCRTSFMFGNPGETRETMAKTMRFALETNPDFVIFNIIKPYPGTEVFDWSQRMGGLADPRWYLSPESGVIMELPGLSREDLIEAQRRAMKRFYMRPKYIISRAFRIRSLWDFQTYLKGFAGLLRS